MKMPDDKLTLKLKRDSIKRAKAFAKKQGTSLSRMVEDYFDQISPSVPVAADDDISPEIKALIGVISLPKDHDWKKDYQEHVIKKYSR